jgi:hypothetical protein
MSDDEECEINEKEFDKYHIKLGSVRDYIKIEIQNKETLTQYDSNFNLDNLHNHKLLVPNFTLKEMIDFFCQMIDKNNIKILENENSLQFILISQIYSNVELTLNKKMNINSIMK